VKLCFGLLIVFACQEGPAPAVISDFCRVAGPDIAKLRRLSSEEVKALKRPRKEAIASLGKSDSEHCQKALKRRR
jgi:hypothetical protein